MKWAWVLVYHSRRAGTLKFQLMSLEKRERKRAFGCIATTSLSVFGPLGGIERTPQSQHPLQKTQTKDAAHMEAARGQQDKRHPGDM